MSITLDDRAGVKAALTSLQGSGSFSGFIVLRYTGNTSLGLQATGAGGVEELGPHFRDEEVQYAVVRVALEKYDTPRREGDVVRTRDVFIQWVGPGVGIIEKGRKRSHLGEVEKILSPTHATLFATSKKRLDERTVIEKSDPASGSHELSDL
eukprot:TRINITY_DN108_c0_g1_i1.p1 TRINITY_DN108_c0_g1~~TRINITY_DN108_c0_g1_i1.p1  ORF type:complete len:164 (+),score=26.27 TRINITY_DN108_c0_g1_i1:39-494(+)